jgi:hypothetical protein
MAHSMLKPQKYVKSHAKSLLNIARHTQGKFLFSERKNLVPSQFQPSAESGGGNVSGESPIKFIQTKLGQSCLGFRRSISGRAARLPILAATTTSVPNNSSGRGMQKTGWGFRTRSGVAAFTLVEAMIALGVMVLFTSACLSSLVVNQVSVRKSKEEAIGIDFLTKYAENIKALPFTSVNAGQPINWVFSVSPLISIPNNYTPVPVNTPAYETFYPDLLWLANRSPQLFVTLTKTTDGSGAVHDIQVNLKLDWSPPLSKGLRQEVQVDFLRTKDASQL